MSERTKKCTRCQTVKPWSDYYAKAKWEDGTTRRPQSRCKPCFHVVRAASKRELRRLVPEDPEKRAIRRDYHRNWQRARYGITPDRYRTGRRPQHGGPTLPVEPFRLWLATLGSSPAALSRATELNERRIRSVLGREQDRIELDTVDRALLAVGDGTTLEDLYASEELAA